MNHRNVLRAKSNCTVPRPKASAIRPSLHLNVYCSSTVNLPYLSYSSIEKSNTGLISIVVSLGIARDADQDKGNRRTARNQAVRSTHHRRPCLYPLSI